MFWSLRNSFIWRYLEGGYDRKAIIFSLFCFKQICGDQSISITTESSIWSVSHCLTYFSLLWVFKLSSHTQCKFASLQNCQKRFSLLPSKSVYGLLSQNHSLKENDWLSNPSSSSVIFNKHFSVVSFREKIIALLCVAGLSGNNARREGTWELCSLSFPFANAECFQQQGSQRRGEKDRACSHWQSFSHLHWDNAMQHPKPWTEDFTGFLTGWLCWRGQHFQITQPSQISTTVILLLPSAWILAQMMEAPVLGSYERERLHNSCWPHLQHLCSCLCLPFPLHPSWLMVFASEAWWGLES